jgi:hypothetical protein
MKSQDKWYRGLGIHLGPDGSVFVSDWYDARACHQQTPHDRTNGRVYKIVYGETKQSPVNVAKLSDAELVKLQTSKNEWLVRHARRVLQERGAKPEVHSQLAAMLKDKKLDVPQRLRALWALHATKGLTERLAVEQLDSDEPWLRAWSIQLLCENGAPGSKAIERFGFLARRDTAPVVRLYLASACQRLSIDQRYEIIKALIGYPEDQDDPNLPMMYWYAAEPVVAANVDKGTQLLGACKIPKLQEFIARRIASLAK